MDLNQFDTSQRPAVEMPLMSPLDQPIVDEETKEPVTISLVGKDSHEHHQAAHESTNRRIERSARRKKVQMTSEELSEETLDILVACTKDWKHIAVDGKKVGFNPINARALYKRFPFIREQVIAFIEDRANFLGNSQRTLTSGSVNISEPPLN